MSLESIIDKFQEFLSDSYWIFPPNKYKVWTNVKKCLHYLKNPDKVCPYNYSRLDSTLAKIYNSLRKGNNDE